MHIFELTDDNSFERFLNMHRSENYAAMTKVCSLTDLKSLCDDYRKVFKYITGYEGDIPRFDYTLKDDAANVYTWAYRKRGDEYTQKYNVLRSMGFNELKGKGL